MRRLNVRTPGARTFLYKENHSLDAWFNKAYGGKQEIPVSMIELPANCSTARNRDSASQGRMTMKSYQKV